MCAVLFWLRIVYLHKQRFSSFPYIRFVKADKKYTVRGQPELNTPKRQFGIFQNKQSY